MVLLEEDCFSLLKILIVSLSLGYTCNSIIVGFEVLAHIEEVVLTLNSQTRVNHVDAFITFKGLDR